MPTAPWFEARGVAVLLTMRIGDMCERIKDLSLRRMEHFILWKMEDLILRSIAKRCVSKDEAAIEEQDAFRLKPNGGRLRPPRPACGERVGMTSPRKRGEVHRSHTRVVAWQR